MRWMYEVKLNAKFTSTEITRSSCITLRLNLKICCLSLERPSSSAFLLFTKRRILLHERLTKAGFTMLLNSCPKSIKIKYEPETLFDTQVSIQNETYTFTSEERNIRQWLKSVSCFLMLLYHWTSNGQKTIYSKLTINWSNQKYRSYLNNVL